MKGKRKEFALELQAILKKYGVTINAEAIPWGDGISFDFDDKETMDINTKMYVDHEELGRILKEE